METEKLNIFLVDDNKLMDLSIKKYLENRFGSTINLSIFYDGESCLKKLNSSTNIVILDYFLNSVNKSAKNGLEILKSIKLKSPKTEVIMFSSNEDIAVAIESFHEGATDFVVKNEKALDRLVELLMKPIRKMVEEFGVPKFLLIFLLVFVGMGTVVYWILKLFP